MSQDKPLPPGSTIGILGGGQLGRMTALAAARLGYRCHVFSPEKDGPAEQVCAAATRAAYDDAAALERFARAVQVVTCEFENVPAETLRVLAANVTVRPGAEVLAIAQDRVAEKTFLGKIGVATAPFRAVTGPGEVREARAQLGAPVVLKTARFGYDGKGQVKLEEDGDPARVWKEMGAARGIVEAWVDFEKEISVILARGPGGAIAAYPAVENRHENHILAETVAPARLAPARAAEAERIARLVAEKLGVVGLLAVEMFVVRDGRILVNEIAPRPHNSGHWTIDACMTSQFEQCVRAVCGLPLGSTERHCDAVMINLLGDAVNDWPALLSDPAARLHLYGKAEARPGRKMGHVTRLKPRQGAAVAVDIAAQLDVAPGMTLKRCRHGPMAYLTNDRFIGRSLDLYGEYSEGEATLLARCVPPGGFVVEAGANIGALTVPLARAVGLKGAVIAFEPQRPIYQILCANLALNGLRHVHALHGAVGANETTARVPAVDYAVPGNFGDVKMGAAEGEPVRVVAIDGMRLPRLDLIKADVQGMGADVLRGAAETIRQWKPLLYLEADRKEEARALLNLLASLDYRVWLHLPPLFNPANFFGCKNNVFGPIISANLLAVPRDRQAQVEGLREVSGAREIDWL